MKKEDLAAVIEAMNTDESTQVDKLLAMMERERAADRQHMLALQTTLAQMQQALVGAMERLTYQVNGRALALTDSQALRNMSHYVGPPSVPPPLAQVGDHGDAVGGVAEGGPSAWTTEEELMEEMSREDVMGSHVEVLATQYAVPTMPFGMKVQQ